MVEFTISETKSDSKSKVYLELEVPIGLFYNIILLSEKYTFETKLNYDQEGITIYGIDDGRISLYIERIEPSDCEKYELQKKDSHGRISVNLEEILKKLSTYKDKKNESKLLNIKIYAEKMLLTVGKSKHTIKNIELGDSGLKPEALESIDYDSSFKILTKVFAQTLKICDVHTEVLSIQIENKELKIFTEGKVGETYSFFHTQDIHPDIDEYFLTDTDMNDLGEITFANLYLRYMLFKEFSSRIELALKDNTPLKSIIRYAKPKQKGDKSERLYDTKTTIYLAPRIEEDDDDDDYDDDEDYSDGYTKETFLNLSNDYKGAKKRKNLRKTVVYTEKVKKIITINEGENIYLGTQVEDIGEKGYSHISEIKDTITEINEDLTNEIYKGKTSYHMYRRLKNLGFLVYRSSKGDFNKNDKRQLAINLINKAIDELNQGYDKNYKNIKFKNLDYIKTYEIDNLMDLLKIGISAKKKSEVELHRSTAFKNIKFKRVNNLKIKYYDDNQIEREIEYEKSSLTISYSGITEELFVTIYSESVLMETIFFEELISIEGIIKIKTSRKRENHFNLKYEKKYEDREGLGYYLRNAVL